MKITTIQHTTIQALVGLFFILCIFYCVMLVALILSTIERKQITLSAKDMNGQLMREEDIYAKTVAQFDFATLSSMGFEQFTSTSFVVKKDDIATYAVLYEEKGK